MVVAWTLFHEVAFYAVFATLLYRRRIGICLMALWFVASLANLHGPLPVHPSSFFAPVHLLFAFGMFVAWRLQKRSIPYARTLLLSGMLLFFGVLLYAGYVGYISQRMDLLAGAASVPGLLGAAELERRGLLTTPGWLIFLGDASYSIYLIHYPVVSHLARLCFLLDRHLHLPIAIWMLILAGAGAAAGCLLHILVERPLLNRLKGMKAAVFDPVSSPVTRPACFAASLHPSSGRRILYICLPFRSVRRPATR